MNEYRIKAYAKINLGLDVVRRLENGYHEVKMVMQTVGIYDVLDFERTDGGIVITTDSGELPTDENNLIYKAAKLMMDKQANTYGNANDIWSFLRSGNFTVDPATKAQAQADIAEDGYWGVNQTSDRIIQFANALTGGDPDKIESMREAFKKGYAQAEKTWGGSLPEISQKTYDAVMEKFDKLAADAGLTTEE